MVQHSLLLVDDDPRSLRLLEVSLRRAGMKVATAPSGGEALSKLAAFQPDAVVIDAAMPDMDGFELCAVLRQDPLRQGVPLLLLVRENSVEDGQRALEVGADDFVARPAGGTEVARRVQLLLARRACERLSRGEGIAAVEGRLEDIGVADLISALDTGKRTGRLHLRREGSDGTIWVREGRVVDAHCVGAEGERAFFRLLLSSAGTFAFVPEAVGNEHARITLGAQALLQEGLRRLVEWDRVREQLPPLSAVFEVNYHALAERLAEIPDEVNGVLRLFDGHRSLLAVAEDAPFDDLTSLNVIAKLFVEGLLMRMPRSEAPREAVRIDAWIGRTAPLPSVLEEGVAGFGGARTDAVEEAAMRAAEEAAARVAEEAAQRAAEEAALREAEEAARKAAEEEARQAAEEASRKAAEEAAAAAKAAEEAAALAKAAEEAARRAAEEAAAKKAAEEAVRKAAEEAAARKAAEEAARKAAEEAARKAAEEAARKAAEEAARKAAEEAAAKKAAEEAARKKAAEEAARKAAEEVARKKAAEEAARKAAEEAARKKAADEAAKKAEEAAKRKAAEEAAKKKAAEEAAKKVADEAAKKVADEAAKKKAAEEAAKKVADEAVKKAAGEGGPADAVAGDTEPGGRMGHLIEFPRNKVRVDGPSEEVATADAHALKARPVEAPAEPPQKEEPLPLDSPVEAAGAAVTVPDLAVPPSTKAGDGPEREAASAESPARADEHEWFDERPAAGRTISVAGLDELHEEPQPRRRAWGWGIGVVVVAGIAAGAYFALRGGDASAPSGHLDPSAKALANRMEGIDPSALTQPTTTQPTTTQPTTTQPTTTQPTTTQPTTAQPTTAQPTTAQPTTAQPTTAQPTTAQPTTTQPTTAQPMTAQPTTPEVAPEAAGDDEGEEEAAPARKAGEPLSLAELVKLGNVALKRGKYDAAAKSFTEATKSHANSARAHLGLGLALYDGGRESEALKPLERAVRINPNLADAHVRLGALYKAKGQRAKARQAYETYLRLAPKGKHSDDVRSILSGQ